MTFKTELAADLPVFFNIDEFAESITYTPQGGAPLVIDAVPDEHGLEVAGRSGLAGVVFFLKVSDVADPREGDTIVMDSVTYKVRVDAGEYPRAGDGLVWRVFATKRDGVFPV